MLANDHRNRRILHNHETMNLGPQRPDKHKDSASTMVYGICYIVYVSKRIRLPETPWLPEFPVRVGP